MLECKLGLDLDPVTLSISFYLFIYFYFFKYKLTTSSISSLHRSLGLWRVMKLNFRIRLGQEIDER